MSNLLRRYFMNNPGPWVCRPLRSTSNSFRRLNKTELCYHGRLRTGHIIEGRLPCGDERTEDASEQSAGRATAHEELTAMKIYTRSGDSGETGLFGGPRLRKDAPRIEAYGTIDELNAAIGVARAESLPEEIDEVLARIQNELFDLGGELATPDPAGHGTRSIEPAHIAALESDIDRNEATLQTLKQFILPGGTRGAAQLHLARTVCRRAERRLVALVDAAGEAIAEELVAYVNRLGDLLFVLARGTNAAAGTADVPWVKKRPLAPQTGEDP